MKTEATTYLIKASVTQPTDDGYEVVKKTLFELNEIEFQTFKSQLSACMVAKSLYEKSIQEELTLIDFADEFIFSSWDEEFCWMKQMSNIDIKFARDFLTRLENLFTGKDNWWVDIKDITNFTCEKKTITVTTEYENILIDF